MTTTDELAVRYGRSSDRMRQGRRFVIIAAAALAAAFVAWIVWVATTSAPTSIDETDLANSVVNEHLVTVKFQVDTAPGRAVSCAVQAMDQDFTVVGWRVVSYPPSTHSSNQYTEAVKTIQPASTGLISRCWVT